VEFCEYLRGVEQLLIARAKLNALVASAADGDELGIVLPEKNCLRICGVVRRVGFLATGFTAIVPGKNALSDGFPEVAG
jgi:hypothetical protein